MEPHCPRTGICPTYAVQVACFRHGSVIYLCSNCGHRWSEAMPPPAEPAPNGYLTGESEVPTDVLAAADEIGRRITARLDSAALRRALSR